MQSPSSPPRRMLWFCLGFCAALALWAKWAAVTPPPMATTEGSSGVGSRTVPTTSRAFKLVPVVSRASVVKATVSAATSAGAGTVPSAENNTAVAPVPPNDPIISESRSSDIVPFASVTVDQTRDVRKIAGKSPQSWCGYEGSNSEASPTVDTPGVCTYHFVGEGCVKRADSRENSRGDWVGPYAFPQFPGLIPPRPVEEQGDKDSGFFTSGEISLTEKEERDMRRPFLNECGKRPRYVSIAYPPFGSPEQPFPLLMAGDYDPATMRGADDWLVPEVFGVYKIMKIPPTSVQFVIDIGANIGIFSVAACKRFPNARILALEPHPVNFRLAVDNVRRAGCSRRVKVLNRGVSSDGRSLRLAWFDSIANSAYVRGAADESGEKNSAATTVQMRTISVAQLLESAAEFFKQKNGTLQVDYLKWDCEGCEYETLPLLRKKMERENASNNDNLQQSPDVVQDVVVRDLLCETHPDVLPLSLWDREDVGLSGPIFVA